MLANGRVKARAARETGDTIAFGDRRYVVRALADDRFAARSGSDGVEFKVSVKGAAPRTRVGSLAFASDHRPAVFRPPIGIALVPKSTIDPPIGVLFRFNRIACSKVASTVVHALLLPSWSGRLGSMRSVGIELVRCGCEISDGAGYRSAKGSRRRDLLLAPGGESSRLSLGRPLRADCRLPAIARVLGSGGFDAFALGCLQDLLIERRERGTRVFRCCEAVGVGKADRVPLSEARRFDPDRLIWLVHGDAEGRDRFPGGGELGDIG